MRWPRRFYVSCTNPGAPRDIRIEQGGAETAARNYTNLWLTNHAFVGIREEPAHEDAAGRLFKWWRATAHSKDGQTGCLLWVREQIGGFDVVELTLEEFQGRYE